MRCFHCNSDRHVAEQCRSAIARLRNALLNCTAEATDGGLSAADVTREMIDTAAALVIVAARDSSADERIEVFARIARSRIEGQFRKIGGAE